MRLAARKSLLETRQGMVPDSRLRERSRELLAGSAARLRCGAMFSALTGAVLGVIVGGLAAIAALVARRWSRGPIASMPSAVRTFS